MPTAISDGNPETFCCDGYRRLVIGLTGPPPTRQTTSGPDPDIAIELKFKTVDVEGTPLLGWVRKVGAADDFIAVEADLGSYMVRPVAGVRVLAKGTWNVAAWVSKDPSLEPETFWRTLVLLDGPWIPPPFYHRLKVLSGSLTFQDSPLVLGFDLSMPGSGSALQARGRVVVQVGFTI